MFMDITREDAYQTFEKFNEVQAPIYKYNQSHDNILRNAKVCFVNIKTTWTNPRNKKMHFTCTNVNMLAWQNESPPHS